jgi:hypothetical protein
MCISGAPYEKGKKSLKNTFYLIYTGWTIFQFLPILLCRNQRWIVIKVYMGTRLTSHHSVGLGRPTEGTKLACQTKMGDFYKLQDNFQIFNKLHR